MLIISHTQHKITFQISLVQVNSVQLGPTWIGCGGGGGGFVDR